jgi:hypothetical protein
LVVVVEVPVLGRAGKTRLVIKILIYGPSCNNVNTTEMPLM